MNKVIINTKKKNLKAKICLLTFLNHFAAGLGSLSVIASLTLIAVGVSIWKILLLVGICLVPAALLFIFKAVR